MFFQTGECLLYWILGRLTHYRWMIGECAIFIFKESHETCSEGHQNLSSLSFFFLQGYLDVTYSGEDFKKMKVMSSDFATWVSELHLLEFLPNLNMDITQLEKIDLFLLSTYLQNFKRHQYQLQVETLENESDFIFITATPFIIFFPRV